MTTFRFQLDGHTIVVAPREFAGEHACLAEVEGCRPEGDNRFAIARNNIDALTELARRLGIDRERMLDAFSAAKPEEIPE